MENDEILTRLVEVEQLSKSNTKRLDELSETAGAVKELATSVSVMANEMTHINKNQEQIAKDVADIKDKPARRWEQVVEKVIFGVICTALGALVSLAIGKLF